VKKGETIKVFTICGLNTKVESTRILLKTLTTYSIIW